MQAHQLYLTVTDGVKSPINYNAGTDTVGVMKLCQQLF